MAGRTALVTGATSGIGRATVFGLAELGFSVVAVARDAARGEALVREVERATGNAETQVLLADLSSQASVRALAAEFSRRYERLHLLVNNAGAIFGQRSLTVDGLERTFALNHLAYFLLTNLLLDVLRASAPARIVNVASEAHRPSRIDFDNLQFEHGYSAFAAYGCSKLANILFTYELARRLEATGVTANCVHPGLVRTAFGQTGPRFLRVGVKLMAPLMRTPERGADTIVYLASGPGLEEVTGKYFEDRKERRSSPISYDERVAARLWQVSNALTKTLSC